MLFRSGQYAAANVRVAVHQKFVELILPPTRVTSAPVEDTVLGRQVRGSSRVAQSTAVRFKPDDDGISVLLEVRGQVASRTITESGPVALTSRGTSSFTVRKPVTVGEAGLVLGKAVGSASARSQLADIQTNFDGVPIMRSLVNNFVGCSGQNTNCGSQMNRALLAQKLMNHLILCVL